MFKKPRNKRTGENSNGELENQKEQKRVTSEIECEYEGIRPESGNRPRACVGTLCATGLIRLLAYSTHNTLLVIRIAPSKK